MEAWLGLSSVYTKLRSWNNSYVCLDKANSVVPLSPKYWHSKGNNIDMQPNDKKTIMIPLTALLIIGLADFKFMAYKSSQHVLYFVNKETCLI